MLYSQFQNKALSLLGYGTMRFPMLADGTVDIAQTTALLDRAIEGGVNYFDTAVPYHGGKSEPIVGEILRRYPRESWYLADKFPGHMIMDSYDPAPIFENQLQKCGVEYFDFYLLHNVYEKSMHTYLDPKWGILDYLKEQKRLGRIRHLGFSCHAQTKGLEAFLDLCGEDMEFCQIQLNYLDWTLQDAMGKYALLTRRGIPVWVMEPVRGGKLASFPPAIAEKMRAMRPRESTAAWAFRFLQGLPNVKMILSGMSTMEQVEDNLQTFAQHKPLNGEETALVMDIAEGMKSAVPCTACRYCCDGCPAGLDIPSLLSAYNELQIHASMNLSMRFEAAPIQALPSACIGCGKCSAICPQSIDVPGFMQKLDAQLKNLPSWEAECRRRQGK